MSLLFFLCLLRVGTRGVSDVASMKVVSEVRVVSNHVPIRFQALRSRESKANSEISYGIIRRNGKIVARFVPHVRPFIEATRVRINPGFPVVAFRGAFGMGLHWDTMLYGIRHGKVTELGRPPAMNSNGPILWHGRQDVWAFDNYDRYAAFRNDFRPAIILMKVGADGRLHRWMTIRSKHPGIPKTILTPDLE